ncbi:glycoside hydrolase family 15 protein [Georgenia sp. AZ-5]|uniref:glycoside hydrolase family 15 protein n=1 Tax=Georgenia sp. AZ-5 TaxID=3367526 RepID=UPI00375513CE
METAARRSRGATVRASSTVTTAPTGRTRADAGVAGGIARAYQGAPDGRRRRAGRGGAVHQRIEDYGPVGDLHTMALVGRDGSVDWLCLPRFDSPACFARLLDDDEAGFWRIAPAAGGPCTRRRYREDSLVLESEWDTQEGRVRLVDLMPVRDRAADLVRIVEGVSGRVPMRMELRLRFDYGHVVPWVRRHGSQLSAIAGPDAVWLDTPAPLEGRDMRTVSKFEVGAGQRVPFVLTHHPSHEPAPEPRAARRVLEHTETFWRRWIGRLRYDGGWEEAVRRSLVTLKALTYAPTGGIVAAATTSLPEQLGGVRNWDYRYCWLRDATFTLQALLGTGFVEEAAAWREWLLRAVAGDPADLQIMYGIDGTRRLPEYEIGWLSGYEGSRPVRVGNAAVGQLQLDVWGEVLDGLHVARAAGLAGVAEAWDLQRALLDHLEGHWRDPDNGLWEVRGARRDFVHSKVMAWAGVDRAVQAVERFGLEGPVDRWRALREEIHAEVCAEGFDADRGTFTQSYGSRALDAALLLIPQVGFLPWDDARVAGTVEAVRRELVEDGFVLRYRTGDAADGLPGAEGAFLACSFWLADALFGIGRRDEAVALFRRLLALRNDLGILSEEYDPRARRQLGNTPQAFSHVALVNAARHLSGTRPATAARGPAS